MCTMLLWSQDFSVSSFQILETDLTANTTGTMLYDPNGDVAAIIKVVTTEKGFSFDTGQLGIIKTIPKAAEIWVYVPHGVKKITISHPQFGSIQDYYFPISIESARTYELVLNKETDNTTARQKRNSQYVVFKLTPPNAEVVLNGEKLQTYGGTAMKLMPFGSYNYRVHASRYLPEEGSVTVNDSQNKHVVNISLRPNFANVTLSSIDDAEIWVNNEFKDFGSWKGELDPASYVFETRKPKHRNSSLTCKIEASSVPQDFVLQAPIPIIGEANFISLPAKAEVYIDSKKVGITPLLESNLLIGKHHYSLFRKGYDVISGYIEILDRERTNISVKLNKSQSNRTFTVCNVSFKMICVEGGTFQMGDKSDNLNNRDTVHQVTLLPYYIGETEVTQELWEAVMGNNPSKTKGPKKPIYQITWNDCKKFIKKLNQMTGQRFRIPTEAEWEYAARGGSKSKGYKYSGSNNINDVAWIDSNSGMLIHDVKTKKPNELGLYDMSGNAMEWCYDLYADYSSSAQFNPMGASSGVLRVVRGGSINGNESISSVYLRVYMRPNDRLVSIGLRLAL